MASLAFHGADEYRASFYMALDPRFEAFDADVGFPQVSSLGQPKLRFKNASRPTELEWSWKVLPSTHELGVSRIPGSLQRRFESLAARAVALGAPGRAKSKGKRESIICFRGWNMPTLVLNCALKKF